MTTKTRIIPALLISAMLLPASARAHTYGPYTYTVSGGKATITDFDATYSGSLSITNELGGWPVTAIDTFAFNQCTYLTSVTFPQ